jgi:hypothetical protein
VLVMIVCVNTVLCVNKNNIFRLWKLDAGKPMLKSFNTQGCYSRWRKFIVQFHGVWKEGVLECWYSCTWLDVLMSMVSQ